MLEFPDKMIQTLKNYELFVLTDLHYNPKSIISIKYLNIIKFKMVTVAKWYT